MKIEKGTMKQCNHFWKRQWAFHLTASRIYDIANSKQKDSEKFIHSFISPPNISSFLPVILGKQREAIIQNILRHQNNGDFIVGSGDSMI